MAFGAYIRKKREEKDIQLNDFAKLLDISPAYWSRIERELEKPPKDELIRKAAEHLGLDPITDQRLIEPYNVFEGRKLSARHVAVRPHLYLHLRNPNTPSWGESYESIVARMFEAMDDLAAEVESGDVVLVTHQLPIWMVHQQVAGAKLAHNPKKRRCGLSSITSFEKRDGVWVEVGYFDPAADAGAKDKGAV